MRDITELLLRYKKLTALFGFFAIAYIVQGLVTPIKAETLQKYHTSSTQIHVLVLTIALPYIAIWLIALVGYLRLRKYTESIGKSKDGKAFGLITTGIFWFTIWLPISTLISVVGELAYRNHVGVTPNVIRLTVYANLLILLPAFLYVYEGSKRLVTITKNRVANPSQKVTIAFIVFAVLYTFMVLQDSARMVAPDSVTPASYYMPDWLIISSVIIPRLICWFLGVQAVYNIVLYRRKVAGVIYQQALKRLASGVGMLIVTIIFLRSLQSLNRPLSDLSLAALFLLVYALLILMAVSYVLIAKGAKQLQTIEDA